MDEPRKYVSFDSEIGELFIVIQVDKVVSVYIGQEDFRTNELSILIHDENDPLLQEAKQQFSEYFSGKRKNFDLPVMETGTSFQLSVWHQLKRIPYGETKSYQDIATSIGKMKAVRAIGQANKANRLPIIIPCHRVIGKNQSLTGYAGQRTDIKERLLQLEGAFFKR